MGPALILLLVGCGGSDPVDTGYDFFVTAFTPETGATVTQVEVPTLTFNLPADPTTCTTDTIRLDALTRDTTTADLTVDFPVELSLSWPTEDQVQLVHADLLPRGWTYAVTVRGGEAGCLSTEGVVGGGFQTSFTIP